MHLLIEKSEDGDRGVYFCTHISMGGRRARERSVVERISPDDFGRDTVIKRADYAAAGIPEYWIVNPVEETITVLTLGDGAYIAHGVFRRSETATYVLLTSFGVSVDAVCDAE